MTDWVSRQIDLNALQYNFDQVKKLAPNSKILAMVKGNAYGHGLLRVARALPNADAFGVARVGKAKLLRSAGIMQRIVLMQGFLDQDDLLLANELGCDIVLHNHHQLAILKQTQLSNPISIWLKINTGMNRLGFDVSDVPSVVAQLKKVENVNPALVFMTHFSHVNAEDREVTARQIEKFKVLSEQVEGEFSLTKSAAIMTQHEVHSNWVRPGIMLYGVSPFANKVGSDLVLKPVMSLRAKIIAIRQQKKGDAIGYDGLFACPEDMPVAVIAAGYADGYPASAKNGTPVLVHGKRCCLAGRVNMDMLTIDLRNSSEAKVGDQVVLWGEGLPVEEVARCANTSAYELITRQSQRESIVITTALSSSRGLTGGPGSQLKNNVKQHGEEVAECASDNE